MVPGIGVAFAVLAGVAWGFVLYANKRYFTEFHSATFMAVVFCCGALWYAPVSLASATASGGLTDVSLRSGAAILASVSFLAVGLYATFRAISLGDVSHVVPITKITPVFVVPIEVLLLGQRLAPVQVAGIAVATVAIYLANFRGGGLADPIRRAVTDHPARLALVSAAVLALLDVSQRFLLQNLGVGSELWIGLKLAGAAAMLAPLGWKHADRQALVRALPRFVALGLLLAFAEHFVGLAFATVPASIASPAVGIQSVVAVLLAGVFLKEGHFGVRLAAAVTAVGGIALIAVG